MHLSSNLLAPLLIVLPPLLLGSTRPLPILTLSILCTASALALQFKASKHTLNVSFLGFFCISMVGIGTLQLIPLPTTLAQTLHPLLAAHIPPTHALLTSPPTTSTLSLNPAYTSLAVLRWIALASAAIALCTQVGGRATNETSQDSQRVAYALVGMGILQTVIGLFQTALQTPGHILGIFPTSSNTLGLISGTFVNGNHAGTFLAMSAVAAAGLSLNTLQSSNLPLKHPKSILPLAVTTGLCGAVFINASRSSVFALLVSLAALFVHTKLSTPPPNTSKPPSSKPSPVLLLSSTLLVSGLLAFGAASTMGWSKRIAWELAQDRTATDLLNAEKTKIISGALSSVFESPWVGIGLDSFGSVASILLPASLPIRMTFVENDPVELILTTGIPLSIFLFALLATSALHIVRSVRPQTNPTRLGLLYALTAFAISSLASFNIFTLGIALPALAIAHTLTASNPNATRTIAKRPSLIIAATLTLLLPASFLLYNHHSTALSTPNALAISDSKPSVEALQSALHETLSRTPTDAQAHAQLSFLFLQNTQSAPNPKTLQTAHKLATRAVELSPSNPLASLTCARTSALSGDLDKSADAFRSLLTYTRPFPKPLLPELLKTLPTSELRARALPNNPSTLLSFALWMREAKQSTALLSIAIDFQSKHPTSPHGARFVVRSAIFDQKPELASLYGEQAIVDHPDNLQIALLTAQAYNTTKQPLEALRILQKGLIRHPNAPSLHLKRIATLLSLSKTQEPGDIDTLLNQSISSLRAHTHTQPDLYSQTLCASARVSLRNQQHSRAQRERDRANALKPGRCKLSIPKSP